MSVSKFTIYLWLLSITQQCDSSSHHIVKMYCDPITSETHSFIVPNQMPSMAIVWQTSEVYTERNNTCVHGLTHLCMVFSPISWSSVVERATQLHNCFVITWFQYFGLKGNGWDQKFAQKWLWRILFCGLGCLVVRVEYPEDGCSKMLAISLDSHLQIQ